MLQEPSSSRQVDARLDKGHAVSENLGTDSLKVWQHIKLFENMKKSHWWKCWREGRLNSLLPSSDKKDGYALTE